MSVLSIFKTTKTKSFSLEATLASWPDAPKFLGKRKKDTLSIEQWLDAVAAGCKERSVDEKNWAVVAHALLGEKALGRLQEFERVLATMQGKDVVWTWERFRVAMTSMGWNISGKKTRAFTVAAKKCGLWWVVGKRDNSTASSLNPSSTPSRSSTTDTRPPTTDARPKPKRQQTLLQRVTGTSITGNNNSSQVITDEPEAWDVVEKEKRSENAPQQDGSVARRMPARAMSDSIVAVFKPKDGDKEKENTDGGKDGALVVRPDTKRSVTEPVSTTVTHAPDWLLNASSALEYLTSEYPKSMTTLSAILITAGSIPAFAVSGGAAALGPLVATHGGQAAVALLSGPTAQAVGAIAMGLGNWLKAQNEGQVTTEKPKAIAAK